MVHITVGYCHDHCSPRSDLFRCSISEQIWFQFGSMWLTIALTVTNGVVSIVSYGAAGEISLIV